MIFWQHIKGLNKDATHELWSFILFPAASKTKAKANLPVLYLNTKNDKVDGIVDCGHFIVEDAENQQIKNAFNFLDTLGVSKKLTVSSGGASITGGVTITSDGLSVTGASIFKDNATINSTKFLYFNNSSGGRIHYDGAFYLTSLGGNVTISSKDTNYNIWIKQSDTTRAVFNSNGCIIYGKCEADYFNATSDIRAKTNLKPLDIPALDLIKKIPLYSFVYKETNTPSIGIIAQDVQSVQIDGFKLVDNEEATGKDMDYMTIHESKLTYILWKAIKEQQEIIENLQNQINELKKN